MLKTKNHLLTLSLAAAAMAAPLSSQAADVGVSISVGEPGFYGRIDIGNTRPELVYTQPVVVQRVAMPPPPVYLRVPPGHERNWKRYCAQYGACGRPVYFVRDTWYRNVYAPQYRRDHPRPEWRDDRRDDHRGPPPGRGHDRHDDRGRHDHDRRDDDRRGDDPGPGRGR